MSRVLLINPPRPADGRMMEREDRCESAVPNIYPPASLCKIGGVLRGMDSHEVNLLDLNATAVPGSYFDLETYLIKNKYDWAVFRSTPETLEEDMGAARTVKSYSPKTQTVMLNFNMAPIAEKIMKENPVLDFYVTNEDYTEVIRAILKDEQEKVNGWTWNDGYGGQYSSLPSRIPTHFASYPMPAWDLIADHFKKFYVQLPVLSPWIPMETIEGCGFHCTFCVYAEVAPKYRTAGSAVKEFEWLHKNGVRYISFFDATFNLIPNRAANICQGIIDRGLKVEWYCNVRQDILDEDLIKLMAEAGCRGVSCGVESANLDILKGVRKESQAPEVVIEKTALLKKYGIKTYYSFVIGLPGETLETLEQTKKLIVKLRPNSFQINTYTPYPKTPLYEVALAKGFGGSEHQLLYESEFSICDLTPEQLTEARRKMYRDIYHSLGWWGSNIAWCLKNPKDLKIGAAYVTELALAKIGRREPHCGPYWV